MNLERVFLPLSILGGISGLAACAPQPGVVEPTPIAITPPILEPKLTIVSTETPFVTETPPPASTPTPESRGEVFPDTLLTRVAKPWYEEAKKRPSGAEWIDKEVNAGRVNWLLQVDGDTYEPPVVTKPGVRIGAEAIISADITNNRIDILMRSHDAFDWDVAKKRETPGALNPLTRIDQAYKLGGLRDMGDNVERATGLRVPFRMEMDEEELAGFVDKIGPITVQVPVATHLDGYIWRGKVNYLFNGKALEPGVSYELKTGAEAVGFIKAVYTDPVYNKLREHRVRAKLVFEAVLKKLVTNPTLWLDFWNYTNDKFDGKGIDADFKTHSVAQYDVRDFFTIGTLQLPQVNFYYLAPKEYGDGGLIRPPGRGDMMIVEGSDPNAPSSLEYWKNLRRRVRELLLGSQQSEIRGVPMGFNRYLVSPASI